MKITKANGKAEYKLIENLKKRAGEADEKIVDIVRTIIQGVKENGDEAVLEYTVRFDGGLPKKSCVTKEELQEYLENADETFKQALTNARDNIYDFHLRQTQQSWMTTKENGVIMGQRVRGLNRVGIYVPGGTASYPSSVLMNAVPAKIAGVKEIIMVTPPGKNGNPDPNIMAAAAIAGVDKVFMVGGAQAIAALAYGTDKIPKVDKIVGPGNIFVATAKKLLYGKVDIDMVAGPSEILIVADKTADPAFLAADLMSQAEHDVLASAILLTTSTDLARATLHEIDKQVKFLDRQTIIEQSLENYGEIIVCETLEQAIEFANELAPEHLELCITEPLKYIGKVDNAGSVFLGNWSPEPLGDYYAGPNHVLPTSGTARFFSPLSVDSFI
ncbi:MAG: histidinol dehydrogenase, partial [Eubacterium sp.]|nr:histidinol dehydrogenase [Eubacterium sp.]